MSEAQKPHPEPRRHHYVPQFLLRRFADRPGEKTAHVHVYDKQTRRSFRPNVRDVMVERDFNALETKGLRISLEDLLARAEDRATGLTQKLIENETTACLSKNEREELSTFVALQMIRGTNHRERFAHFGELMQDEIRRRRVPFDREPPLRADQAKAFAIKGILKAVPEYAGYLAVKDFFIFKSVTELPFWIGDNPVSLGNNEPAGVYGNMGIACRGIEIHLPISPKYTLGLWCPTIKHHLEVQFDVLERKERQIKLMALMGKTAIIRSLASASAPNIDESFEQVRRWTGQLRNGGPVSSAPENVKRMNSMQVTFAERFVASNLSDFSLAELMLNDHPELKVGPRMSIS